MKQLLFCYKENKELFVRHTVLTDVYIPIQDIISPQKTTLTIPKTSKVELSDIVIIRDNDSGVVDYIGYVDTLTNKNVTEIACYPLINIFDNDYVLDQMFKKDKNKDGTVVDISIDMVDWFTTQINREFVNTDDNLQALPFKINNCTRKPVLYKKIIDTSNLLEVYIDAFINTGVYIVFSGLTYHLNKITGINCDIYCNTDEKPYVLRYDNPQIQKFDIVDNTFTNYNKIIVTEELAEEVVGTREPKRYYFYLLNDNSITIDANDSKRIKQVRSKEMTMNIDANKPEEENAKAMLLAVYNELQAPEYNLQITIDMFNNENIKLYRRVDFVSDKTYNDNGIIKNVIYTSNITKIERLNEKQVRITLGALRNSLTDFKKKVEAI